MTAEELAQRLLDIELAQHPLDASMLGIPGYDDRLPDFSASAAESTVSTLRSIAGEVEAMAEEGLGEIDRQTLDLVRHQAPASAGAAAVPLVEWTIGDFHGAPVTEVLTTLPKLALDTDDRAQGYLDRLGHLPGMLEVAASRHADGIAAGRCPVRRLVQAAVAQLDMMLSDPAAGGILRERPSDDAFGGRARTVVDREVRPALAAYRGALAGQVLDAARDDEHCGLVWLPGGEAMYAALVRFHTSTRRAPEDLHAVGLEMVQHIGEEFAQVGGRLWGDSTLAAVFDRIRHDPSLRYTGAEEMLDVARAAVARAEDVAPEWFGAVPDERCLVEPVPAVEEAGSAPAYYIPGAFDGSRQGTYFVNTSRPTERSRHLAETTAFHEAVPGHHFHITIALRQPSLSLARRVLRDTACTEGWGLYAERLADEMGLYSDDVARLGMLTADIWRAGRLVVDTGIHQMGWSRSQAVQWFRDNTPLSPLVIDSEVDRYITYPAQALSYMVGRLELLALRSRSASRLKERFDLRQFHDVVLRAGPLPLGALGGAVDRWVEATLTASA